MRRGLMSVNSVESLSAVEPGTARFPERHAWSGRVCVERALDAGVASRRGNRSRAIDALAPMAQRSAAPQCLPGD